MTFFNFQAIFVESIRAGNKIQTICGEKRCDPGVASWLLGV